MITKTMILILVGIVYIAGVTTATDCPDGWLAYKGSCYLFGHDHVHFTEAEEYCRHHGSHLVRVDTTEENMFLKGFMSDTLKANTDYWLGMTDEITEGIWQWYGEDDPVNMFDWAPTEPQDANSGEDCAMFGHLIHFQWADVGCVTSRNALCEKSGTVETPDIIG